MKRWRIDGSTRQRCVAAGLAFPIVTIAAEAPSFGVESQSPAYASFSPEGLARVGDYMRSQVSAGKIPGAVRLIQQHGHPVFFESFGTRDAESQQPMTADTIFRLYSMSKAITSVRASPM
jgi:CubicO group peptidase (beta-lactamase class C family)